MVPKTSVIFNQLTWLIDQKDFMNVSHPESFRSYKTISVLNVLISNSKQNILSAKKV
jgi:hypothetical protein